MYSKTTFFALITTVSLSAVEVAFEPEFPCNRGCQKRIQREFHRALLTQKPSPNSVINSPFDFELNRSQRGYGVPPVCVQRTQKINWKTFVEQEICQTVRNTLPECKYRKDDCVRCFGNGTYSTSYKHFLYNLKTVISCLSVIAQIIQYFQLRLSKDSDVRSTRFIETTKNFANTKFALMITLITQVSQKFLKKLFNDFLDENMYLRVRNKLW